MPMNNRIMVPRQTTHPEALAWRAAVIANGGSVSGVEMYAADQFCKTAQFGAVPFRSVLYRFNPFMGGFNGALVPLFRGPSRFGTQYGGTTDTNVNFVSGDYSLAAGLRKENNTTAYLNTGFASGGILAMASTHLGFGLLATETRAVAAVAIGALAGSNAPSITLQTTSAAFRSACFSRFGTASDLFGDNTGTSHSALGVGDIVASWPTMYRNGAATGVDATTSQNPPFAHNYYVFAINNAGVSAASHTDARLGWYSIGTNMTAAQALAFSNACNAFYTAIGRS